MAEQNQPQGQQVQIKITDELLKGVYANMAMVSHSGEEFMFDFMNVYPNQPQGIVTSRVIVSPAHMKRIVAAMQDNLKRYEDQFGKIPESTVPHQDFGFRTE